MNLWLSLVLAKYSTITHFFPTWSNAVGAYRHSETRHSIAYQLTLMRHETYGRATWSVVSMALIHTILSHIIFTISYCLPVGCTFCFVAQLIWIDIKFTKKNCLVHTLDFVVVWMSKKMTTKTQREFDCKLKEKIIDWILFPFYWCVWPVNRLFCAVCVVFLCLKIGKLTKAKANILLDHCPLFYAAGKQLIEMKFHAARFFRTKWVARSVSMHYLTYQSNNQRNQHKNQINSMCAMVKL